MEDWLKVAQTLPVGYKHRYNHCSHNNRSAIISFDGHVYSMHCFKCGTDLFHNVGQQDFATLQKIRKLNADAADAFRKRTVELPEDFTLDIPDVGMLWLLKASITPYIARQHGIGWTPKYQRVILPVYNRQHKLVFYQGRAVVKGHEPKYLNPVVDRRKIMFWALPNADTAHIIVTEDILSAIRIGKFIPAVSLLGTKVSIAQVNRLAEYKHVTTWLDPDEAGINGAVKVRKAVGILTKTSNIVSDVDPKNLTNHQIQEVLRCHKH